MSAADLAAEHDEPSRAVWLAERLGAILERNRPSDALLIGPWLGAQRPRAVELSERVGVPLGEVAMGIGGAAGLRFEAARTRMFERLGVSLDREMVARVDPHGPSVHLASGERIGTDTVILAIGGVASGGVVFDPPEQRAGRDVADAGSHAFRLSVDVPVQLASGRRDLDVVSSIFGPPLDEVAWPVDADPSLLESVGVAADPLADTERVFAAGDVMADKPRTVLQAVYSGIRAGAAAAGEPGML